VNDGIIPNPVNILLQFAQQGLRSGFIRCYAKPFTWYRRYLPIYRSTDGRGVAGTAVVAAG